MHKKNINYQNTGRNIYYNKAKIYRSVGNLGRIVPFR